MNTKVKLGIAAAIVAALVALIVLDQKTAPNPDSKAPPAGEGGVTVGAPASSDPALRLRDDAVERIHKAAEASVGTTPPADDKVKKGEDPAPGKVIKTPGEEYVVVEGDSFEKIAKKKLGDGKWANLIAEANPSVKATSLRPGQKIVIPSKPEKKVEEKTDVAKEDPTKKEEAAKKSEPVFQNDRGQRIYTVQPGDTLSGISVKVYNTSRYVEKIHDANKERLEDPSMLYVGMKLVMPDLPKKEMVATLPPGSGTVKTGASGKTYTVQPGENLWKIASKIAGDKGIEETMRSIVSLNPDKLKGIGDAIRSGWQLIMPE